MALDVSWARAEVTGTAVRRWDGLGVTRTSELDSVRTRERVGMKTQRSHSAVGVCLVLRVLWARELSCSSLKTHDGCTSRLFSSRSGSPFRIVTLPAGRESRPLDALHTHVPLPMLTMSLDGIDADAPESAQDESKPPQQHTPVSLLTANDKADSASLPDGEADGASLPAAVAITAIDKASVHRICSGQVILDLATAVKELIENALDARATHVAITLKAHGAELLEVSDNGSGIEERDYGAVARKHHTSKLRHFSDLGTVTSYGFRGEALSSLCALGTLTLSTKTATQQLGTMLSFDNDGRLVQQRPVARTQGTTVTLTDLFSTLPVRYKAFIKTVKREYARMLSVVQAYGLMAAGVRLTVSQLSKQGKSTVFSTQGSTRLLDAITNVFGSQQAGKVQEVDAALVGDDEQPFSGGGKSSECRVRGWVSTGRDGRTSNDRQYIYVNQRPVDLPKLQRVLNDAFRAFSSSPGSASFPFLLLDLQLPTDCYDVNVTPNKRTVLLHEEAGLMAAIRRVLVDMWAPSQQTFAVNHSLDSYMTTVKRELGRTERVAEAADDDDIPASLPLLEEVNGGRQEQQHTILTPSAHSNTTLTARPSIALRNDATARRPAVNGSVHVKKEIPTGSVSPTPSEVSSVAPRSAFSSTLPTSVPSPLKRQKVSHTSGAHAQRTARPALPSVHVVEAGERQRRDDGWTITGGRCRSPQLSSAQHPPRVPAPPMNDASALQVKHETGGESRMDEQAEVDDRPAPPPAPVHTTGTVRVDVDAISRYWRAKAAAPSCTASTSAIATPLHDRLAASLSQHSAQPADDGSSDLGGQSTTSSQLLSPSQLTRVVSKQDFAQMNVVGQFNLGFIIAQLGASDLFIIDQHAADEKYRYERLRRLTRTQQQPLLTPLPLHLSPTQSALLADHLPVFTAHGFSFAWSGGSVGDGVVDGLVGLPWSKDKQFGVSDVHELLELVGEGVRAPVLPKLLSVFASRACRSAVMIG